MSILSRAGDLIYTFRFLKLLVTPFEKTNAFKLGVIDKNGKKIKDVLVDTPEKMAAYNSFHKLVFNIKKLMAKAPGGSSRLASYAAALYLLKENFNMTDKSLKQICEKLDIDTLDFLKEESEWFIIEDKKISPGLYRVKNDGMIIKNCNDIVRSKDRVVVRENNKPVGEIFGLDIYKVIHAATNQEMYVTTSELYK